MPQVIGTVWISTTNIEALRAEGERMYPLETGGILMGYWVIPLREVVITDVIGPGPNAQHDIKHFIPDADYHDAEIAERYNNSGRIITYLGDWHTHPGGGSYLSHRDRTTLRAIAKYSAARAPAPLMAILAGGPRWRLVVWEFTSSRKLWSLLSPEVVPLQLRTFSGTSD